MCLKQGQGYLKTFILPKRNQCKLSKFSWVIFQDFKIGVLWWNKYGTQHQKTWLRGYEKCHAQLSRKFIMLIMLKCQQLLQQLLAFLTFLAWKIQ